MCIRPIATLASAFAFGLAFAGPTNPGASTISERGALGTVFVENKGQWNSQAEFLAQGKGVNLWITKDGPVYDFVGPVEKGRGERQAVRVGLVGGRSSKAAGLKELNGRFNYFVGKDPRKWVTDVRRFAEVQSDGVYDGVSVRYYAENGSPRYDLTLAPGADPSEIAMRFDGADGVSVLPDGNLQIKTSLGTVEERGLAAYQEINGQRDEVACRMVSHGNRVSFDMGAYDPTKDLVIDPLVFSTYLTSPSQLIVSTNIDSKGNLYAVGSSSDWNFPTFGGATSSSEPSYAFICELNPTATGLIYGDFIGEGVDSDPNTSGTRFISVGVDDTGAAYALGCFGGPNLPVVGPVPTTPDTELDIYHTQGFLIKLSPTGNSIAYSQLLGIAPLGMAVDASGDAYLYGYPAGCGSTPGAFITKEPYPTGPASSFQSMVLKLDPTGTKLIYATYLPMAYRVYFQDHIAINNGPVDKADASIAVDAAGEVAVIGSAYPYFPTTEGALFPNSTGDCDVVAKLNSKGSALVFATYLGSGDTGQCFAEGYNPTGAPGARGQLAPGAANSSIPGGGFAVAEDAEGNVAVAGQTDKSNFPNSVGAGIGQDLDIYPVWDYVIKFNETGAQVFSRYLSWMTPFIIYGVGLDSGGNAIVAGNAVSGQPTTPDAFQINGPTSWSEPYIAKYSPNGTKLVYGTYFGTTDNTETYGTTLWSLHMRADGVALISGGVSDPMPPVFPTTTGAYETTITPLQTSNGKVYEAGFLAAISMPAFSESLTLEGPNSGGDGKVVGTVSITSPIAGNNTLVYIQSNNSDAVPPSVVSLLAGTDAVSFLISTKPVTAATTVTISALLFGQTIKATMVLDPGKFTDFYVSPTSVIGGQPSDAVVRFAAPAPTTGYTVAVSSAKPVSLPSSLIVPGGDLAISTKITTIGVSSAVTVPLKATFGTQTLTASITVLPAPLKSLLPTSSVVAGGNSVKMTVALGGNPGPAGDEIALTHTGPVTMQSSVNIPASATESSFTVAAKPVAAVTTAKITASFGGSSKVATITIEPAVLTDFYVSPTSVTGGQSSDGVLKLNGEAYSSGDIVAISASGSVAVPATVTIPGGETATSFSFKTLAVASTTPVRITAKLASTTLSASISINPAVLTGFTLTANTVVGGKSVTGTITLNGPAGPGGDLVGITGSGPVSFTHYAIISQNESSVTFPISTNAVTTTTKVKFTVVLGSVSLSQTLTITP